MENIVFVAPSSDDLTKCMSNWLKEIANDTNRKVEKYFDGQASTSNIYKFVSFLKNNDIIFVFYGHGTKDAFLTALDLGFKEKSLKKNQALLCNSDHFSSCRKISIIGYCCWAARKFGKNIRAMRSGNKFLGFVEPVGIVLGTEEREHAFKRPMRKIVHQILEDGEIISNVYIELKENYYKEKINWDSGDIDDELSMLVSTFLKHNADAIDLQV